MLLRLALRNLLRHRRRTLVTLAAVGVGVAAVVGVRGVLDGLQGTLIDGVVDGGTGALQIHRAGWAESLDASPFALLIEDTEAVIVRAAGVDDVVAVAPRLTFPGLLSIGEQSLVARVTAIDPAREALVSPGRAGQLVAGTFVGQPGDVVVGAELASIGGATEGTVAAVLTGDVDGVLNAVDGKVSGRTAAVAQAEKRAVTLHIESARAVLRLEKGEASEIAVAVKHRDDVDATAQRLRAALGPGFEVHTWMELAPFVRDARATQNSVLGVLTSVFLVVILLGVANTLLMSVMERVREIGTLVALGMRRRKVLTLFMIEGGLLGAAGAVTGCVVGVVVVTALGHYGIVLQPPGASLPATIHPSVSLVFLLRMIGLAVVGAVVASFLPAWRASRLRPVEALSST
ncbi:MAG: FtsX-like permease family protein [Deltaproteobacteria bacterium]|nr:FtsX-like permease family protein [Deltaproteobacteria bacterium]